MQSRRPTLACNDRLMVDELEIQLGESFNDKITGFAGVAIPDTSICTVVPA